MVDFKAFANHKFIGMVIPDGIPGKNSNELAVSVCFNINKYCSDFVTTGEDGNNLSEDAIKEKYTSFVTALKNLYTNIGKPISFTVDGKTLSLKPLENPFPSFLTNKENPNYDDIRKQLWEKIFQIKLDTITGILASPNINVSSRVKIYNNSTSDKLISDQDENLLKTLHLLDKEAVKRAFLAYEENDMPEEGIVAKLNKINDFGRGRMKIAEAEFKEFKNRVHNNGKVQPHLKEGKFQQNEMLDPVSATLKLYVEHSDELEIDEIVHSFSKIADDPILSRLMGLTVDFQLTFDKKTSQKDDFKIQAQLSNDSDKDVYFLETPVYHYHDTIQGKDKHAYFIKPNNSQINYFDKSILRCDLKDKDGNYLVTLQTVDPVSQILKTEDYRNKAKNGQHISESDRLDALTRGILFTHQNLNEILKPVDIVKIDEQGNHQLDDSNLHEEHFARGYRVNIKSGKNLHPLTTRSVKIEKDDFGKSKIYQNDNVSSCIHIDSPMAYMENGDIKSTTTNLLFEYSGELLKLKSAFAKAYNPKKINHIADKLQNYDDDGIKKVEERWNGAIRYYSYPSRKPTEFKKGEQPPLYNCFYDIPKQFKNGNAPKLRFKEEYTFIVHQEYLNGWGLPLDSTDGVQLTINDLINNSPDTYFPTPIPFLSAENKKAPILVHKRSVNEELGNSLLSDKPALDHFVVRSDNADDSTQYIDERHILPPKIDLETAFWHGLLSSPNLSTSESFDLKTRSNCPFADEKDRNSDDNKKKKCPECNKMSYCGGTQLKQFYSNDFFTPPFITDSTINGVSIKLYWQWDEDVSKRIPNNDDGFLDEHIAFGGTLGVRTKSYLLVANGAKEDTFLENHPYRNFIEFSLKKGVQLYAVLTNTLTEEGELHLKDGVWFKRFGSVYNSKNKEGEKHPLSIFFSEVVNLREKKEIEKWNNYIIKERNKPKIISLTHAVKEPLITPKVFKLFSTPNDHKHIEHINDWLNEKEYQQYKIGVNVIAKRVSKSEIKDTFSFSKSETKAIEVFGYNQVEIYVSDIGTPSNELIIEGTINGTDWVPLECKKEDNTISKLDSVGHYSVFIFSNVKTVRLNVSKYNSGKIEGTLNATDYNLPIGSSISNLELSSHFERLDAYRKIYFLRDVTPTGALELWMRKEEFIDNPEQNVLPTESETNHIPNEPVVSFLNSNFSLEYKIEFSNEIMSQLKDLKRVEDIDGINDVFRSLITKLNLQYDFKTTCFEEREYYLKDISKFKGFFTDENFNDNGEIKALDKLEEYALPKIKDVKNKSELRFKVLVLNNSQPSKPDVAFAVTTIQETRTNPSSKKTISIQKGNIVTIYLKRGRLKSGKDERVGVIVDADSLYNKLFKDSELISKAGRDIVSDRYSNRSQYLQFGDIIIPENENNEYKAAFDNELGIYHFLPKFDIEKQLWKFEVELNIKTEDGKQIHNPFINFSLVHFQPFSINYNDKTADASLLDLKNDCRISDVENSTWCYLLPERKLSVFFDKPNWLFDKYGEVDLTVSFDHESLHHFNSKENEWKVRSNFIVTVQGSDDAIEWQPVGSWLDDGIETEKNFKFNHPLLTKSILNYKENLARQKLKFNKWAIPSNTQHSNKYSYFRVRFIEVEWFKDETWDELIERYKRENPDLLNTDAVDNEEMRIRFVELIY